jgi:hypothetical protein
LVAASLPGTAAESDDNEAKAARRYAATLSACASLAFWVARSAASCAWSMVARLGAHIEYHVARALPCCRTRPSATSSRRGASLLRNVASAFSPLACSASLHPALGWGEASRGPCRHEPLPCSTPSRIKVAAAQRKPSCVLHFADQIWLLLTVPDFHWGHKKRPRHQWGPIPPGRRRPSWSVL